TSLAGVSKTWHWLIKHPVEFSKNKHTPSNKPAQQARHPGLSFRSRRFRRAPLLLYLTVSVCQIRSHPNLPT
ncbi:hypothetical protein, partial [Micromonospora sonneratiae]